MPRAGSTIAATSSLITRYENRSNFWLSPPRKADRKSEEPRSVCTLATTSWCGADSRLWRSGPRLLPVCVLWRNLVAASPAAAIAFLVLLPVAATILATAATRRPEQRHADYPDKAQTQKLPATHGHSKNGIASGFRFSCIRHRVTPCLARFVTILTGRRRLLVPELSHDSQ